MRQIRTAAGILNQTPLDWSGNARRITSAVSEARDAGVQILCLPELCIPGYGCEDMFLAPHVWEKSWDILTETAALTRGMLVTVGLPLYVTNGVYNCAAVLADGEIQGFTAKQHLAGDGLHYEPRWFRPWPEGVISRYRRNGREYPIGDLLFEVDGIRVGFEICEDAWVAGRPGNRMAECGVDVILNPSASHFAFGKHEIRKRFVLEGSRAFGVAYVYANLIGNEAGRSIYDGGGLIAVCGDLVACGSRFTFAESAIVTADVDIDLTRTRRAEIHSLDADVREDVLRRIHTVPMSFDDGSSECPGAAVEAISHLTGRDNHSCEPVSEQPEEFTRAVALGLFDYMRKSRSRGFIVSMSGGADSSATAVLIRNTAELAVRELGPEGVASRLNYMPELQSALEQYPDPEDFVDALMRLLFTGVYQATRNSSETTENAARDVTVDMGGTWYRLDVDPLVALYTQTVEETVGRRLTWQKDDITLQNIQARTRAPSVWMLANIGNALLLSTSNRSEAAVGYATMDGDTAGGLSPLAGIDKAFLREWLRVMEVTGAAGLGPYPVLSVVNAQQPTAELRPTDSGQTDEGDLMPYPVLEEIETLAIRNKLSPEEILRTLQAADAQYSRDQYVEWIRRFFRLWSRNQWKRERYAPSFHVDDRNLDPRTWCRFPILSGGFEYELERLSD